MLCEQQLVGCIWKAFAKERHLQNNELRFPDVPLLLPSGLRKHCFGGHDLAIDVKEGGLQSGLFSLQLVV